MTFSLLSAPAGALIDAASGVFTWTPGETQGPFVHTFTVRVSDNTDPSLADEEEISVTILEVNDAPVLDFIDDQVVDERSELVFRVVAADLDVLSQSMVFSLTAAPEWAFIGAATGVVRWFPDETHGPGVFTFVVRATDSGDPALFDEQEFTVTVTEIDDPPVLSPIAAQEVAEETELTFGVSATELDSLGQTLTFGLVNAPTGATIDSTTGDFRWTPSEAQGAGSYGFDVTVSDGVFTVSQEIAITVNEVNAAPVLEPIGNRSIDEGSLLTFTAIATDRDLAGQTLTFSLEAAPVGAAIDPSTGVFRWTPSEAQGPGTFTLTVRVTDDGSPQLSAAETITISVADINMPPVASDDAFGAHDRRTLTVSAVAGVLANDSDADGDPLTALLVSGPTNGTVTLNADGSFAYTPNRHFAGTDSFGYRISDGSAFSNLATVVIAVHRRNEHPEAIDDAYSVGHGRTLNAASPGVLANDTDADDDVLTAELTREPAHGDFQFRPDGTFSYTPFAGFVGTVSFRYRVSDGHLHSRQATATITVTNTAPVAAARNYTVVHDRLLNVAAPGVLANLRDPDDDALTAILVGGAAHGAVGVSAFGSFNYTPNPGYIGPDSFSYRVSDGFSQSAPATVSISVINRPPVLQLPGPQTVHEGQILTFTVSATDPDGDALTFASSPLPTGARFDARTFSWEPTCDQVNTYRIEFTVTDSFGATARGTVTIVVPDHVQPPAPYNAEADRRILFTAMHGGLTGWGTDVPAIFRVLEGKSPDQIKEIRRLYKAHRGKTLDADLQDELSGLELKRAQALLDGNRARADAHGLKHALSGGLGFNTDEEEVYRILSSPTRADADALKAAYLKEYRVPLEDALRADLDEGTEIIRALALLNGLGATADAQAIKEALVGGFFQNTDEAAIYNILGNRSPTELNNIKTAYENEYNVSLEDALKADLDEGPEIDRALAILAGDQVKADAARLRDAMDGLQTNEKEVWDTLDGRSPAHLRLVEAAYLACYKVTLRSDIEGDFSGVEEEKTLKLLAQGCLTDAERLYYAIKGLGTDPEVIRQVLTNRSKAEIARIKEEYQRKYNEPLEDAVRGDLDGRDRFDALQSLQGRPESLREALQNLVDLHAFERLGFANGFSATMSDILTNDGQHLDNMVARARAEFDRAMLDVKRRFPRSVSPPS